ncbi:MAG: dihydrofolate reductase [Saprospiraceae bacterium]|nr:dihydrofolate reductase [Saprospiraceae bacterium]
MMISAIAAMSRNRAIGVDNDLPWHMPEDFKFFKRMTKGHHILMGRRNFNSLDNRPLKHRTNIVLTRNPFFIATGIVVVHSLEEGIAFAEADGEEELFIIGGEEVYRLALPYCDRLYLTEIDVDVPDADAFFPEFDHTEWKESRRDQHSADDRNPYDYTFVTYERL